MTFRISNNLVGILNFITFLLSIPILAGGIWLSHRSDTDCEKFLQGPVIAIGVFLLIVSLCGLIGACCKNSLLLWIYLFVMFLLIVLLFCFTIFAFVVTNKGAGEVVSGRGYKEYKLGDYSNWLQKRVENSKNWRKIRSCLVDSKVCQKLAEEDGGKKSFDQFVKENLSPLQNAIKFNLGHGFGDSEFSLNGTFTALLKSRIHSWQVKIFISLGGPHAGTASVPLCGNQPMLWKYIYG